MSGTFIGDLDIRSLSENGFWKMLAPLEYVAYEGAATIIVPIGFETDLASIPNWFQAILPVNDKHRRAAVIHDYLYTMHAVFGSKTDNPAHTIPINRVTADSILLEAMCACHEVRWRRQAIYWAVRVGGGAHWVKDPNSPQFKSLGLS